MTEDNKPLDGNVEEPTTPDVELESEDTSEDDLESLFGEEADEEKQKDAPVTREELQRLQKGIQKIATVVGRQAKPKEEATATPTPPVQTDNDDLKVLFYSQTPKAKLVEDDLKIVAAAKYGGSELKAWNGESWIQDKASALAEAKSEEEKSKDKIKKPSSDVDFSQDIGSVKPEDVEKLPPSKKLEWIKAQAEKERNAG